MTRIKLGKKSLDHNPNLGGYIDTEIFDENDLKNINHEIPIKDELGNIEPNSEIQFGDNLSTVDLSELATTKTQDIGIEENNNYLTEDPQVVGYMDLEQQELIYEIALKHKIPELDLLSNKYVIIGVLDLGSGRSDIYRYLTNENLVQVRYVGVDNNPIMIKNALKKNPTLNDENYNYDKVLKQDWFSLTDEFEPEEFDWSFCIGSLNIDYGTGPKDKWDKLLETIKIGLHYSKKGICLILLHSDPTGNYQDYPIPLAIDKIMEFYPNNKFEVTYSDTEFIYKLDVLKEKW